MRNLKKFLLLTVLVLILGIGLVLTLGTQTPPAEGDTYTVSLTTPETRITVNALKEFCIKIEGNIATGYSWSCKTNPDIEKGLIQFLRKKTDEELQQEPKLLGAPSFEILVFKAQASGLIELEYHRPWEKEVPPEKTHKIIVTVQ